MISLFIIWNCPVVSGITMSSHWMPVYLKYGQVILRDEKFQQDQ